METEFKVGDRVEGKRKEHQCLGTVVGEKGMVWVHWDTDEEGVSSLVYGSILTRIEPDVPQPKYRVGQRVRLKNDALDFPGEMGQVIHLGYYVSRSGHWGTWVVERKLEAVPEVCQTCGGKVADA